MRAPRSEEVQVSCTTFPLSQLSQNWSQGKRVMTGRPATVLNKQELNYSTRVSSSVTVEIFAKRTLRDMHRSDRIVQ
jgi:hypothetical protein